MEKCNTYKELKSIRSNKNKNFEVKVKIIYTVLCDSTYQNTDVYLYRKEDDSEITPLNSVRSDLNSTKT